MAGTMIAGLPSKSGLPPLSALSAVGLILLIGLKLGTLFQFGPTMMPDSAGYIDYADQILSGDFLRVDLGATAIPMTLARPIGYPAIIALAKIVAEARWAWAVVLFQFAASVWATILVYRLARRFGLGSWASLGVAAAQATAMQFVLDQAILSDSLCASTTTAAVCILSGVVLRPEGPRAIGFLGAGALMAAAFLMRDVIAFVAIGFVPLAAGAAMREHSMAAQIDRIYPGLRPPDRDAVGILRMEPRTRRCTDRDDNLAADTARRARRRVALRSGDLLWLRYPRSGGPPRFHLVRSWSGA